VADWYEAAGYVVVARNWRCREGELDLIARKGPTLVVCEVKTRTGDRFGAPFEAVTRAKQLRIRRLTARWLAAASPPVRAPEIRFDVASVRGAAVEVIEGAF
jgi:putative endonuclease